MEVEDVEGGEEERQELTMGQTERLILYVLRITCITTS